MQSNCGVSKDKAQPYNAIYRLNVKINNAHGDVDILHVTTTLGNLVSGERCDGMKEDAGFRDAFSI